MTTGIEIHVPTGRNNHSSVSKRDGNVPKNHGNTRNHRPGGGILLKIIIMHTVLSPQEPEEETGEIVLDPDFPRIMMAGCQAITVNGVVIVIPELRIAILVGSQAITVISRMKKEYSMVGLMTITIPGVVPMTATIL